MLTESEPFYIQSDGWVVRVRPPDEPERARVLLLLHGWTGDEKVMWIFTRKLTRHFWILAPRGPISSPEGGYGWLPHSDTHLPALSEFYDVTGKLLQSLPVWAKQVGIPAKALHPLNVMGFSQGAAMTYALTAYFPENIDRLAALAGFLPRSPGKPELLKAFTNKKIFIAHGTMDETIPIGIAQEAVQLLQAHGAQVTYCESDAGHKLSVSCLRGLEEFFSAEKKLPDQ